jgi:tripartite-type tricarboxylate transporter receptor subunit TctC
MSGMKRRSFISSSLTATAFASPAFAQAYPNKPVRMIVPFPAGGATDVQARALSIKLGEKLGQNVVVENRPGAGGTIGSQAVAQSAPDGYTILLATSSTHSIGPVINAKIPYDAQADFTALGQVATSPNIVLVPLSSPAKTMGELIAFAKKNPGKLNYASSGNGTIVHLTSELFKAQSGTFIVHIPYRGTALAIPDLISGKVDVLFDSLVSGLPHVKDGKLRALAITSEKRSPLAPDLPTVAEALPGFESVTWFGLYGPKGMAADIVQKINSSLNAALTDNDVKDRFARLGSETTPSTPAAFATLAQNERAKWKRIIEQRKIVVE